MKKPPPSRGPKSAGGFKGKGRPAPPLAAKKPKAVKPGEGRSKDRPKGKASKQEGFERHFEGRAMLDELLAAAGSPADSEGCLLTFQDAVREGDEVADVIPSFWEDEPRFTNPELARRLYQNLLGLYDLVKEGKGVMLDAPPPREKREKPPPPPPPGTFPAEGPDDEFVELAFRHLEGMADKDRRRLMDRFENMQDDLLSFLDDAGLSDGGYASARYLLFELHAMLELGHPAGLRSVREPELTGEPGEVPEALTGYLDEVLFEAAQDDEQPLSEAELPKVRAVAIKALSALWRARKV